MLKRVAVVGFMMLGGAALAQPADKKPAPPPAEIKKPPEAPAMEMPKPPAEVAEMFKAMSGKWSCTGKGMDMATGKEMPMSYSVTAKMDLDNFWIQSVMASKKSKEMPMVYKFTSYTTYDAKTKSWNRIMVDNMGMWEADTSTGLQGQTISWEGKSVGGGMSMSMKHVDEMKGPKEMTVKGTASMDGKTWMPVYEATCKK